MESSAGLLFSWTWQRPRFGEVDWDCAVGVRGRRRRMAEYKAERCMVLV